MRVPVFVISPVIINILIGFKEVPQVHCYWLQVNHIKVFLLSFFCVSLGVEEALIQKHHQLWLIVVPGGTKAHWVHPSQFFLLAASKSSQDSRTKGNECPFGSSLAIVIGYKEIISIESSQWEISPIGFIPRNFSYWKK